MVARLRTAGDAGVCLSDAEFGDSYTARNAISSARQMGYQIESEPCRVHEHRGRILRYRLKGGTAYLERTVTSDGVAAAGSPDASAVTLPLFPEPYVRGGNAR